MLAGRRKAQRQKAARERAEHNVSGGEPDASPEFAAQAEPAPTPFRSFLDQLEEAMAEAAGQPTADVVPRPKPEPRLEPALPPSPPRVTPPREFRAPMGSFDSAAAVDHDAHGFGRDNPASEEVFEQLPAFTEVGRRETPVFDPHGLHTAGRPREKGVWQKRLSSPKAAQDAFVLQTVFGARGGRRSSQR